MATEVSVHGVTKTNEIQQYFVNTVRPVIYNRAFEINFEANQTSGLVGFAVSQTKA